MATSDGPRQLGLLLAVLVLLLLLLTRSPQFRLGRLLSQLKALLFPFDYAEYWRRVAAERASPDGRHASCHVPPAYSR